MRRQSTSPVMIRPVSSLTCRPGASSLRTSRSMRATPATTPQPVPPVAFVWDTPLLFETGLASACDAVVFVDTPRAGRVGSSWCEYATSSRKNRRTCGITDFALKNTSLSMLHTMMLG